MRNLVFFEALAATADLPDGGEEDALQKELKAAIIVLRLFADWVESPAVMIGTPGTLANIKAAVADVPASATRQLFETVVSAVAKGFGNPTAVAAPLLAYAWILEERDQNDLAEDVLLTVASAIEPLDNVQDYSFTAGINTRLGDHAMRRRDFDGAEFRYRRQLTLALAARHTSMALEARARLATVQNARGNLGIAEAMLTGVIEEAITAGESRAEAYARRVRGSSMVYQERWADALREFYRAYRGASDWLEREWLLSDMAGCASMLGLRRLARTVFVTLSKTAHNQWVRVLALLNLLEIAVLDRDRALFATVSRQLETQEVRRDDLIVAQFYRAAGTALWEGADAGLIAFQEVVDVATRTGVHDIAFRAAERVQQLQAGIAEAATPTPTGVDAAGHRVHDEWIDLTRALEADCRLRMQVASGEG